MPAFAKEVQLGGHIIGGHHRPVVLCEVGTTAAGDLQQMLALIDAAAEAGADYVKPMIIGADHFMADKSQQYTYTDATGTHTVNMYEMFKGLEFTAEQWVTIANSIYSHDMGFLATVDYIEGVDLAVSLGAQGLKLSAWDIRNFPLIKAFAETKLPILIDLGPALLGEIVQVMDFLSRHDSGDVILLHGTHGDIETSNLRTIPFLKETFEVPVGWTADQADWILDEMAYAVGAHLLEKRLTLGRDTPGHHNLKALEPTEFKEFIQHTKVMSVILGKYGVYPSLEDLRQKDLYFTSIVAARDMAAGEVITEEMLAAKRPGKGISPLYIDRFVGKRAKRDFKKDETWTWDAV